MNYLVFQVGCIECGVRSYPVNSFDRLEDAIECAESHKSTWDSEGGDGFVVVVSTDKNPEILHRRECYS